MRALAAALVALVVVAVLAVALTAIRPQRPSGAVLAEELARRLSVLRGVELVDVGPYTVHLDPEAREVVVSLGGGEADKEARAAELASRSWEPPSEEVTSGGRLGDLVNEGASCDAVVKVSRVTGSPTFRLFIGGQEVVRVEGGVVVVGESRIRIPGNTRLSTDYLFEADEAVCEVEVTITPYYAGIPLREILLAFTHYVVDGEIVSLALGDGLKTIFATDRGTLYVVDGPDELLWLDRLGSIGDVEVGLGGRYAYAAYYDEDSRKWWLRYYVEGVEAWRKPLDGDHLASAMAEDGWLYVVWTYVTTYRKWGSIPVYVRHYVVNCYNQGGLASKYEFWSESRDWSSPPTREVDLDVEGSFVSICMPGRVAMLFNGGRLQWRVDGVKACTPTANGELVVATSSKLKVYRDGEVVEEHDLLNYTCNPEVDPIYDWGAISDVDVAKGGFYAVTFRDRPELKAAGDYGWEYATSVYKHAYVSLYHEGWMSPPARLEGEVDLVESKPPCLVVLSSRRLLSLYSLSIPLDTLKLPVEARCWDSNDEYLALSMGGGVLWVRLPEEGVIPGGFEELLTNGGFEQGELGWTLQEPPREGSTQAWSSRVNSGNYSLKVEGDWPWSGYVARQAISVDIGAYDALIPTASSLVWGALSGNAWLKVSTSRGDYVADLIKASNTWTAPQLVDLRGLIPLGRGDSIEAFELGLNHRSYNAYSCCFDSASLLGVKASKAKLVGWLPVNYTWAWSYPRIDEAVGYDVVAGEVRWPDPIGWYIWLSDPSRRGYNDVWVEGGLLILKSTPPNTYTCYHAKATTVKGWREGVFEYRFKAKHGEPGTGRNGAFRIPFLTEDLYPEGWLRFDEYGGYYIYATWHTPVGWFRLPWSKGGGESYWYRVKVVVEDGYMWFYVKVEGLDDDYKLRAHGRYEPEGPVKLSFDAWARKERRNYLYVDWVKVPEGEGGARLKAPIYQEGSATTILLPARPLGAHSYGSELRASLLIPKAWGVQGAYAINVQRGHPIDACRRSLKVEVGVQPLSYRVAPHNATHNLVTVDLEHCLDLALITLRVKP
ncbi:hypothetical protein B6U99_06920 [Candidatus Geothermarchaeota archaeon ex4572_27]|nr:MAG: hypothetical protein B6U99_06920 [Candidatus Geothermarchaeota archaeon ex4572_27]